MTFAAMLEHLYKEQFTGPLVIQFGQGVPSVVELPQPAKQIRLDKGAKARVDLTAQLDSRL